MSQLEPTSERSTVLVLVRWIGTLGGALVGLGALAFSAGFLAQRAQYDYAQVPFVFVDYWSYAETGAMSILTSLYALLQNGLGLTALVVLTILIVLALEMAAVRRTIVRPELLLLSCIALTFWATLLISQQLQIHHVRRFSTVTQTGGTTLTPVPLGSTRAEQLPISFPFSLAMPASAQPSKPNDRFPATSIEAWDTLASELERGLLEKGNHLHIRPRPEWTVVPVSTKNAKPGETGRVSFFSGLPVPADRLEEARARKLYSRIVFGIVVALWGLLLLIKWERVVRVHLAEPMAGTGRARALLQRWKEEIWFSARWVMLPIATALIAGSVLLASEGYGVLAMPYLGQELVDVGLETQGTVASATEKIRNESTLSGQVAAADSMATSVYDDATGIASKYLRGEADEQEGWQNEWRTSIDVLEQLRSVEGTNRLSELVQFALVAAPELAAYAQDAWNRSAERTSSSRSGYILYYPRSETDYLRLLSRNPPSHSVKWTIHPIRTASITQVRVKGDQKTLQLIAALRGLKYLDPSERMDALTRIGKLGHERTLEVFMGGVLDPSPTVYGPSITEVGIYAGALQSDDAGIYRRGRATALLVGIVHDATRRIDMRGTAATSLHVMLRNASEGERLEACARLRVLIEDDRLDDEHWELRGTVVTSLGLMGCVDAERSILALLSDSRVPVAVHATIPTVLVRLGRAGSSVPVLAEILVRSGLPQSTALTTISALAMLPQGNNSTAVGALMSFIERMEGSSTEPTKVLRRTAVAALGALGDRSSLEMLHRLALRTELGDDETREAAVTAIDDMDSPRSLETLMRIAENVRERRSIRCAAISACGTSQGLTAEIVQWLDGLVDSEEATLQPCIFKALLHRAERGSGQARQVLQRRIEERKALLRLLQEAQSGAFD
jgi:HEAT repeat protein